MPLCSLPHRALIAISGEDAEHFLEGLITSDLPDDQSVTGSALLTPQGKLLFTFLTSRAEKGFLLECDVSERADLIKRLNLYKLRAKVIIEPSDLLVFAGIGEGLVDLRHNDLGVRHYGHTDDMSGSMETYTAKRAELGILEGPDEIIANQDFPHDVALDLMNAVSFSKGCFVGQEVVSRVKHRGTARRRPVLIEGENLEQGVSLYAGERDVGAVRLVSGNHAVAVVRLDHINRADVHLGSSDGPLVTVAAPPHATYSLEADKPAD